MREPNTYRIRYTDEDDPGCPTFSMRVRAYDKTHAEEKFWDCDDEGWKIISISLVKLGERNLSDEEQQGR